MIMMYHYTKYITAGVVLLDKIEILNINDLVNWSGNARRHSPAQVDQIARSIGEFGFTNPVLISAKNQIIAGHGRVMAAKKLSIIEIPCIRLSSLTEIQTRAYVIADNQIALNAEWDTDLLALEIEALKDSDFDLSLMGLEESFIEDILKLESNIGLTDEDDVPETQDQAVTVLGDVWILGNHRLMCGDSTSIDAVEKLMAGQKADMVFTDPPYGISIVSGGGKVGGRNIVKAGVYAPVAGDDSIDVAVEVIQVIATLGAKVEIIWGGNYYANSLPNSSCWIVWDKQNTGNFADCELAWTNQTTAVRKFEHMWNGMIKASENGQKRVHPTQKPVALAAWCLEQYGDECKTVLDLFGGSGSTLIACEKTGRKCRMMELAPKYCDVIIKRWQDFTGKIATREDDSLRFNDI